MEILGLIPARGGSKGIYKKNLALLAGRPLVSYTCEAAQKSKLLNRTILSTDDKEIADIGQTWGIEVPFLRPKELSLDDTPILPVINHALVWLAKNQNYHPDLIVLLQPTSPLRRTEDIDAAIQMMIDLKTDSVVSVVQIPHQYHPLSAMTLDNGLLKPYIAGEGTRLQSRQEKPAIYARNGPAVLVTRHKVIKSGSLYGECITPYIMGWPESLDIDMPFDLYLAECLLRGYDADT